MLSLSLNIRIAIANLVQHKLRSSLAILGIWIGSAAIVALLACSSLATQTALAQFKNLGTDFLSVDLSDQFNDQAALATHAQELNLKEINALVQHNPAIASIAPYFFVGESSYYNAEILDAHVMASTAELEPLLSISLQQGRFINELDLYNSYCVIGADVADQIATLGEASPLGKQIKMGNFLFTVIGVMNPAPNNLFFIADLNRAILIPIARSYLFGSSIMIDHLLIKLKPGSPYKEVQAKLIAQLTHNHPNKKFMIRDSQQLLHVMLKQRRTFNGMLTAIAIIALLSGGIGVMNMMLVAVTERRKEIGLRMAVGARKADIRGLFLNEALILSIMGGLIGTISGQLLAFVLAAIMHWSFQIDISACLVGFAVASIVGIAAGSYPAYRASELDPLEILHS